MEHRSERLSDKKLEPSGRSLVGIVTNKPKKLTQAEFEAIIAKQARGKVKLKDLRRIADAG